VCTRFYVFDPEKWFAADDRVPDANGITRDAQEAPNERGAETSVATTATREQQANGPRHAARRYWRHVTRAIRRIGTIRFSPRRLRSCVIIATWNSYVSRGHFQFVFSKTFAMTAFRKNAKKKKTITQYRVVQSGFTTYCATCIEEHTTSPILRLQWYCLHDKNIVFSQITHDQRRAN